MSWILRTAPASSTVILSFGIVNSLNLPTTESNVIDGASFFRLYPRAVSTNLNLD
jgi:hypothetical protein